MNLSPNNICAALFLALLSFNVMSDAMPKQRSNIDKDESIQFFTGAAWLDGDGKFWNIPIHVWVYELENSRIRKKIIASALDKKYGLKVNDINRENFDRRINHLIADNERGKNIVIDLLGKHYLLEKTSARGQSLTVIKIPVEMLGLSSSKVDFTVVLPEDDTRIFKGLSLLVPPKGLSIISDIDDTVKISEVTDHARLFDNTFYNDFEAVPGIAALYTNLVRSGMTLHFVSSSPWQLYPELNQFFEQENFPPRSMSLKTVRFKDSSFFNLFKKGDVTKPLQINPLFEQFPERTFILIGDSGEQDVLVYTNLRESYPDQVAAIFIRDLNTDNSEQNKVESTNQKEFVYFKNSNEIMTELRNLKIMLNQ